jgi:hypothetical protein
MPSQLHTPLNNAQLELLKLFSTELSDQDLRELKQVLLEFKFKKVTTLADKAWSEQGWTDETVDKLLHSHLRTSYKSQEKHLSNKKPQA